MACVRALLHETRAVTKLPHSRNRAWPRPVDHAPGWGSDDVSTASKSEPVMRPIECRSSFDHFELGAPLTYQLEPLSARIIPYVFNAWSTMRVCFGNPEMSTVDFSRTRSPIGGSDGSSED